MSRVVVRYGQDVQWLAPYRNPPENPMKAPILSIILSSLTIVSTTHAGTLLYEPFNYSTGNLNGKGGSELGFDTDSNWSVTGTFDGTSRVNIDNGSIAFGSFPTVGRKLRRLGAQAGGVTDNPLVVRPMKVNDASGVLWMSYLTSGPQPRNQRLGVWVQGTTKEMGSYKKEHRVDHSQPALVQNNAVVLPTSDLATGDYLMLSKHNLGAASGTSKLWIMTLAEYTAVVADGVASDAELNATVPAGRRTTRTGSGPTLDGSENLKFELYKHYAGSGTTYYDEVRITTSRQEALGLPDYTTWNLPGSGSMNTKTNWTDGEPGGRDATARLVNNITSAAAVNLLWTTRIGHLEVGDSDGSHAFTVTAAAGLALRMDVSSGAASIEKTTGAADVIETDLQLDDDILVSNTDDDALELTGSLSDAVGVNGFTKTGSGPVVLTGSSTYAGPTQVEGGALLLNGTLSASDVTVVSGGTLGGTGTVSASVTVAGALSPGESVGALSVDDLVLQDGSILHIEHDGGAYDRVIAGTVDIESGAQVTVNLSNVSGTPGWEGVVLVAVDPGSVTGFDAGNWAVTSASNLVVDLLAGGLTLVSSTSDDQDDDGLPDAWEQEYFGNQTNADPHADSDIPPDGQSNIEEYIAGTNPTNGSSYFTVAEQDMSSSVVLSWPGVSNRLYGVEATTNLCDTNAWMVITDDIGAVLPTTSFTNSTLPDVEHLRINVKMAP